MQFHCKNFIDRSITSVIIWHSKVHVLRNPAPIGAGYTQREFRGPHGPTTEGFDGVRDRSSVRRFYCVSPTVDFPYIFLIENGRPSSRACDIAIHFVANALMYCNDTHFS